MSTFIIIKPDAFYCGLVGKIISRFEQNNFTILRIEKRYKNKKWFYQHYQHLIGKMDLLKMEEFMTGPLIGIILKGDIKKAREIVGSVINPAFGTIRYNFNAIGYRNLIHASDTPEAVEREIGLFFSGF